ncbi:MAG: ZIP family metal transporter [Candidatus Heimdallarchaeota archaeon]
MLIIWIVFFSLLGSVGAILAAAGFLLLPGKIQNVISPCLIAYATGSLLAAALLGLIVDALTRLAPRQTLSTVLGGILLFFFLEKLVIWWRSHYSECEVHSTAGPMLLIGDAFHNATDGMVIATSFLASIPMGIAVALSVIAHEIAQEVGDFAILLHSGYSKRKALWLNILSGLSTIPTAILTYYALSLLQTVIPYVMAFSAASFLYIALTDLFPELHRKVEFRYILRQLLLVLTGIGTLVFFLQFHP